jgi:hypothetical protein
MQGEMPGFPFPGRPGGEHDEPLLDMIISRRALPPDAPQEMHDLARMLAALAGPGEPEELAREAAVRAAFRRAASPAGVSPAARPMRHRRPRRSRVSSRSRARLAAALVVVAAGLGSVLAAYTDVLPSPFQQLAHTGAAPAPHHTGSLSSTAVSGARHATPGTVQPNSRPTPGPGHSPGPGQLSGPRHTPRARLSPLFSPSSGHGPAGSTCTPGPGHSAGPSLGASAYPGPAPTWSQAQYCTGSLTWPPSQPTAHPNAP